MVFTMSLAWKSLGAVDQLPIRRGWSSHPIFHDGNPYNGYIKYPYENWVNEFIPLLYGNNGSLDPIVTDRNSFSCFLYRFFQENLSWSFLNTVELLSFQFVNFYVAVEKSLLVFGSGWLCVKQNSCEGMFRIPYIQSLNLQHWFHPSETGRKSHKQQRGFLLDGQIP